MTPMLENKKIILRPFNQADIVTWHAWFNDPEVTRYMNKGSFPNTSPLQEEFLQKISKSKNDVQLAIVDKKSGTLAGVVGVHEINWIHRHGKVSIVLGDSTFRGQGLGSEAIGLICRHSFMKLNLNKLYAGLWAGNVSCLKAFEKNGFKQEGLLKEQYFCQGAYMDEIFVGLTKKDFDMSEGKKNV